MPEKRTVLVIEDDHAISNFICRALTANDYKAIPAASGKEGLSLFFSHSPDLVLLDLGLPDMDGLEVLEQFSDLPQEVPTIIISARDRESEKVKALDMGADDYVAKPFDPAELVARVKAHLARYQRLTQGGQRAENGQVIRVADLEIYPQSWKVYKAGREIKMPNREFELLKFLAEHPNIVFSKDRLFETIWGFDYVGDSATVTVHVGRIRDKIEDDPSKPRIIETVWGAGYRLNAKA